MTTTEEKLQALATKAGNEARLISALQMLESFRNDNQSAQAHRPAREQE